MAKPMVMVSGLPGKMARTVAESIVSSNDFFLAPYAFTGADITDKFCHINNSSRTKEVELIRPEARGDFLSGNKPDLVVDFTHPSAVNSNAELYCGASIPFPFVMGTTGGDRKALEEAVRKSSISAVIAPNMAKQIVALQAVMEKAANDLPGLLNGYSLKIEESHQKGKADTSGTAKAMVGYFNKLGIKFDVSQIRMIREEAEQEALGVPREHLKGHGWHTYYIEGKNGNLAKLRDVLLQFMDSRVFQCYLSEPRQGFDWKDSGYAHVLRRSLDETVEFLFEYNPERIKIVHNINGRRIYADGAMDALRFLREREGEKGKVHSMIDVLKASEEAA